MTDYRCSVINCNEKAYRFYNINDNDCFPLCEKHYNELIENL